jgi:hypothetical protein
MLLTKRLALFVIIQMVHFGNRGITVTDITPTQDRIVYALLLQSDNKIVAVGQSGGSNFLAITRYINPFTLKTFTASYGSVGLL